MTGFGVAIEATSSVTPPPLYRTGTAPVNDNLSDAIDLIADVVVQGTLVGATSETNEFLSMAGGDGPTAAGYRATFGRTVWYRVVPPFDGTMQVAYGADTDNLRGAEYISTEVLTNRLPSSGPVNTGTVTYDVDNSIAPAAGLSPDVPVTGGVPLYLQVIGLNSDQPDDGSYDPTTSNGAPDFFIGVSFTSSGPPVLETGIFAPSALVADFGGPVDMGTSVQAVSVLAVDAAVNARYAFIAALAQVEPFLSIDANQRVEAYYGDPPGSGYAGTGHLPCAPSISVVERVGPALQDDALIMDDYVNIMGQDRHSTDDPRGFALAPVTTAYSVERWLQIRVQPPFNSFAGLRVWAENADHLKPGWTVNFGRSSIYMEPVATASTVATDPLPAADPGVDTPNLMDSPLLHGDHDEVSLWLVIQIEIDLTVAEAETQPIGYMTESWTAVPIQLRFAWTET